ncbi:DUF3576 domain-containing protein [Pikeienuella sp. HZG-20]|uniref:DUF3576 domain-containing protein n=1 Tax=Paludibacillus litoralis TaxID=3133267 RepID=UPI0030EE46D5
MLKRRYPWFAVIAVAFLVGCSGSQRADVPVDARESLGGGFGTYNMSKVGDIFEFNESTGATGDGLTPVNRYLWRASLDTLAYLPLASTDPFTGVVATDWATAPATPDERFKVTAYVKSPTLAATSLQVAVYREVRGDDGAWATAPVAGTTARQLEDAILLRARQLKIEEREAG